MDFERTEGVSEIRALSLASFLSLMLKMAFPWALVLISRVLPALESSVMATPDLRGVKRAVTLRVVPATVVVLALRVTLFLAA